MNEARFAPPKAATEVRVSEEAFVTPEVMKQIRAGCLAGVISSVSAPLFALMAIARDSEPPLAAADFIDVGIVWLLAYGIYRRSRVCAVLMLIHFVGLKFLQLRHGFNLSAVVSLALLGTLYVHGVLGAFEFHRLRRRWLGQLESQ